MSFEKLLPIAIMFGVLAGVATICTGVMGFTPWPLFVGWAVYLIAGAKPELLLKELAALVGGAFLAYLTLLLLPSVTGVVGSFLALPLLVTLVVFLLVVIGQVDLLSLTSAFVIAYATYVAYTLGGFGGELATHEGDLLFFSLLNVVGFVFGYVSVALQTMLSK